ncbi:MAG: hypothetical protein ACR2PL_14900, partial [Dehalococcoidia bacterium]
LGVFVEFIANLGGWTATIYRWWYLFGATFAAVTLGLGSAYLLLPLRWARMLTLILAMVAVWACYRVLTVPLNSAAVIPPHGEARPPTVQSLPVDIKIMVAVLNIAGTVSVVGGALWSAWLFWRRRTQLHRVASSVLIAAGGLVVASSGSLARLGRPEYLFLGEFLGIALIFLGFLRSQEHLSARSLPLLRHLQGGRRPTRHGLT